MAGNGGWGKREEGKGKGRVRQNEEAIRLITDHSVCHFIVVFLCICAFVVKQYSERNLMLNIKILV